MKKDVGHGATCSCTMCESARSNGTLGQNTALLHELKKRVAALEKTVVELASPTDNSTEDALRYGYYWRFDPAGTPPTPPGDSGTPPLLSGDTGTPPPLSPKGRTFFEPLPQVTDDLYDELDFVAGLLTSVLAIFPTMFDDRRVNLAMAFLDRLNEYTSRVCGTPLPPKCSDRQRVTQRLRSLGLLQ